MVNIFLNYKSIHFYKFRRWLVTSDIYSRRLLCGLRYGTSYALPIVVVCGIIVGYFLGNFAYHLSSNDTKCFTDSYKNKDFQYFVDEHLLIQQKDFRNNLKGLVFIGVLTANKYLQTRAIAVFNTWGKLVPGKLAFFTSEASLVDRNLPLVILGNVDDSYPPQKKSFLMLKYMHDHLLDYFEFFMRADDDVYIHPEKLEKFLRSLNSSKPLFIGQAGMGNFEEFGHLSLQDKENFCMGGPGIIFSRETLVRVIPHIKECLRNLRSLHEDVEIGRCMHKFAGVSCTWSYEMQTIFYHNSSGADAFTGSLNKKEVHKAITLHPVKEPSYMYRLHSYMQKLKIKELESELVKLIREAKTVSEDANLPLPIINDVAAGQFYDHISSNVVLNQWIPRKESDILMWDFFQKTIYQHTSSNPRHKIRLDLKTSIDDVIRDVMEIINKVSKERGRIIDFKEILYGYVRHTPGVAYEYIIDMLLLYKKYRGKKMTVPVRRHAYVQVPFGPLHIRESLQSFENALSYHEPSILEHPKEFFSHGSFHESQKKLQKIHFIVPLSGRFQAFLRFIRNFKNVCLKTNENVQLSVVSFHPNLGDEDTAEKALALISNLKTNYPHIVMNIIQTNTSFARAYALHLGARQFHSNDLLFFVDVDIAFTASSLERIRMHTVLTKQVYFPIVFSEYNPDTFDVAKENVAEHLYISEDSGYWRTFGYGIVAIYKGDLDRVGGLDINIIGWGKEDVDLYEKVLKDKKIQIFRAPDPGLVHIFHPIFCDIKLDSEQYKMCQGTYYSTYASSSYLSKAVLENPEILHFKNTDL